MCQQFWRKTERLSGFLYPYMYLAIKRILSQTAFWILRLDLCFSRVDHSRTLLLSLSSQLLTVFDLILI